MLIQSVSRQIVGHLFTAAYGRQGKGGNMAWRRSATKYGNSKTYLYGIKFDSKHEAQRYLDLKLLEDRGIIHDLRLQVKYELVPAQREASNEVYTKGEHKGEPKQGKIVEREVAYYADFDYYTEDGLHVVEDAKGMKTKEYIIKRKLMLWRHGIRIREV